MRSKNIWLIKGFGGNVVGLWLLAVGCWWLLAVGFWLLVKSQVPKAKSQ